MKILYIITQADGGGAQKYVLQLAKRFKGAIAAGDEAEKLFTEAQAARLDVYRLNHLKRNINPWHDILAVLEIRQLLDLLKPDIVHLNSSKAGILGSFAAIGKKTKVVFTAHGFVFNEPLSLPKKNLYLAAEKVASDFRDLIITVSEADRESALKYKLIDPKKIITIRNGIAPTNFLPRKEARARLGLPEQGFIFGALAAKFYPTKGIDILVDAIAKINKNLSSRCIFALVGGGSEIKNFQSKISEQGLSDIIKITGQISNASAYLKAFDVFVLPSRKEGLPYTLLEAMQAGLPIVAADVGGVREALDDAGTIIPPQDASGLANTLSGIITDCVINKDTQTLKILSEKALLRSREFTEEQMLSQTEAVYKKILQA